MKIAIHHRENSFSERWINYCKSNNVDFKVVDCYSTKIVKEVKDCNALMWHFHHANPVDSLISKSILFSIEQSGKVVFPDFKTCWHFDDKLAQKYLLEAENIPVVPTHVFYDKKAAIDFVNEKELPLVFKLRKGAGSLNVRLIESKKSALKIIEKVFGDGLYVLDKNQILKDKFNKLLQRDIDHKTFLKFLIKDYLFNKQIKGEENGYVYFQDFIRNNSSDVRVIVVGGKCFAIRRFNRNNDFRASGSGKIEYLNNSNIDRKLLKISFNISKKIGCQAMAYDFIYRNDKPLLIEMSYGFSMKAYDACHGFWNSNLDWFQESFNPQYWMIEDLISRIDNKI
jgi:glutathione synthase/RimK-type ligase-like ATP-grasp enzyme